DIARAYNPDLHDQTQLCNSRKLTTRDERLTLKWPRQPPEKGGLYLADRKTLTASHLLLLPSALQTNGLFLSSARILSIIAVSWVVHYCWFVASAWTSFPELIILQQNGIGHTPYVKSFLKKVILEIESAGAVVIDELYEQLSVYMTTLKDDGLAKEDSRITKEISFLYPTEDHVEAQVCQSPRKLLVPLSCSLNMLEGDTGCSLWPSGLFLSEFILSCPELFSMKSCFEVVLSDGDLSTLANLKINLELNHTTTLGVECLHLPWESALERDLRDLMPDIVLGADVIYDPQCIPHLVRVIATLLTKEKSNSPNSSNGQDYSVDSNILKSGYEEFVLASMTGPVAYLASVVRNIDTYNYFLKVAQQANLIVADITQNVKIYNFLPYMRSYQRSSVRLLGIYRSFH
ncbi:protein-lysine N-methyltransferase EEF2KMT isoform X1, partial [Tanacetum coccineum]